MKDCARITTTPVELGFPVKITRAGSTTEKERRTKSGKNIREVISTRSFLRTKLDKGEFALLPGFKTVKDEMQLMMSNDESDLAEDSDLNEVTKNQ